MMTETTPPTNATEPRRNTRDWRIIKQRDYVQSYWFRINTTLARTIALSLRALSKVTPEAIATLGVGATLSLPLDPGAGNVLIKKLGKGKCKKLGLPFEEGLAIIAPGATGALPSQQSRNRDLFIVPASIVTALHARKDPVFATQQMVAALLAMACGASRDNDLQEDHSRLFYESALGPKRMLFIMVRGHDAEMQARWRVVRDLLAQVYFRSEPLVRPHDGAIDEQRDLRDLGPFRKEALEAWRLSRHVFEDDGARDKSKGRGGTASMGATSVDPTIFQGSATGIVDQLALHVHRALNASTKDLSVAVFEHTSGRAMARTRTPRPSTRRARARRPVSLAIARGTFMRRTNDEQQVPILRRAGRRYLLAYTSPRSSAADT